MREYKNIISLSKNGRGIWDLDTTKGCYGDCYAFRTANRYGIDFSKTILRSFKNEAHKNKIIRQIEKIDMDFIRIGCAGDPSEDWEHTINIIKSIRNESQLSLFDVSSKKQIVIITKHWKNLTIKQLETLSTFNICINTSVSALDNESLLRNTLEQYEALKPYCKSILRIVSCDFNLKNEIGRKMYKIQNELFKNENTIDTVFRPTSKNPLIIDGVINVKKMSFMKNKALVSKFNKKTFLGKCNNCLEMCGLNK